jgi:hypothetical protein
VRPTGPFRLDVGETEGCCCPEGGGFCDCVHTMPATLTLHVPTATPRLYVVPPGGGAPYAVGLPAGLVGTFGLDRSDAPANADAFTDLYSGGGSLWQVWAKRASGVFGDQVLFRLYAKFRLAGDASGLWCVAIREVFGCRGAFPVPGIPSEPFGPHGPYALPPFMITAGDGSAYEPTPPDLPPGGTIFYYLKWVRCPASPVPPATVPSDQRAFFDYLHVQLPGSTLNDRRCCNGIRGKLVQAAFTLLSGSDCGVFAGLVLGGAMPVGYGNGPGKPFCCMAGGFLRGFSGARIPGIVVDGVGTSQNLRVDLAIDPAYVARPLVSVGDNQFGGFVGLLDTDFCTLDELHPKADCDGLYYEADVLLQSDVDVLPLELCGCELSPVGTPPDYRDPTCTSYRGYTGARVRIAVTGAGSVAGTQGVDPDFCNDPC